MPRPVVVEGLPGSGRCLGGAPARHRSTSACGPAIVARAVAKATALELSEVLGATRLGLFVDVGEVQQRCSDA